MHQICTLFAPKRAKYGSFFDALVLMVLTKSVQIAHLKSAVPPSKFSNYDAKFSPNMNNAFQLLESNV